MRVERVAALKNDVMNLLRSQEPPVEGLAETLIVMFEGRGISTHNSSAPNSPTRQHPPDVLDYCIQHLGAILDELDEKGRLRVRASKTTDAFQMAKWTSRNVIPAKIALGLVFALLGVMVLMGARLFGGFHG